MSGRRGGKATAGRSGKGSPSSSASDATGDGSCEHAYLFRNCPYCALETLRLELAGVVAERDRLLVRIDAVRVLHRAAIAEREDAVARAVREKRLRVALERYISKPGRRDV